MTRIGIDLGTTNTVACVDERVLGIDDQGESSLPSVVAFLPNGRVCTGRRAALRRAIDSANTVYSSKRVIGRSFSERECRLFRERYPVEIVEVGGGRPAFKTRAGLHSPTDIAAMLLDRIAERLEGMDENLEVVLTVPHGFNERQRDETLTAALHAGLRNMHLVDEASATAFAYRQDPDLRGRIAVYDFGGGTLDVAILDCTGHVPEVVGTASDLFLGGNDIDRKLADWATLEVMKHHNWDLSNTAEVEARLVAECEAAKIRLASSAETLIDLTRVDPDSPIAREGLPIRRQTLDRLCLDLVQRALQVCDEATNAAGMRPGEVSAVLLAGGTTHLPVIRESVEAYFGRTALAEYDPTEVVAIGACAAPGPA
jgi:molecular chaperone DnaK